MSLASFEPSCLDGQRRASRVPPIALLALSITSGVKSKFFYRACRACQRQHMPAPLAVMEGRRCFIRTRHLGDAIEDKIHRGFALAVTIGRPEYIFRECHVRV